MVAINHRAFLDLERALSDRSNQTWRRLFHGFRTSLLSSIRHSQWHSVNVLIDTLNTDSLVVSHAQVAQTIGMSALLLGASRKSSHLSSSQVALHPPIRQLRNGVVQWGFSVSRNLPAQVRLKLHQGVAALEQRHHQDRHIFRKDAAEAIDPDIQDLLDTADEMGESALNLAASLLVSRLSSFGFLQEANAAGSRYFQISAVLDKHTCPVCEALDGQIFPIDDGLAQASAILDAEDPDSLKLIAPWISPTAANMKLINDADAQDLVDMGVVIPPFHGLCRCIPVDVEIPQQSDSAAQVETLENVPDRGVGSVDSILAVLGIAAMLGGGDDDQSVDEGLEDLEDVAQADLQPDQDGYDPAQDPNWVDPTIPDSELSSDQRDHRQAQIEAGWQ